MNMCVAGSISFAEIGKIRRETRICLVVEQEIQWTQ